MLYYAVQIYETKKVKIYLFAASFNILPKNREHLGQKLLFCWRKGIADCWGHLISISICLSAWTAISGCHSWRTNENILHQISSSLMQPFTSGESPVNCGTSSLTSFGLLLCSPCNGVFRRAQHDAEPRAVTALLWETQSETLLSSTGSISWSYSQALQVSNDQGQVPGSGIQSELTPRSCSEESHLMPSKVYHWSLQF